MVESLLRAIVRVAARALAVSAIVAALVVAVCRAVGRWSAEQVGEALVVAGLVALAFGALGLLGSHEGRGATMGFAASAGSASLEQRTRMAAADSLGALRRVLFLALVGAPLIVAGVLLDPRV